MRQLRSVAHRPRLHASRVGEISAAEFKEFIGEGMRLDKVRITKEDPIQDLLDFYMGKNTPDRKDFIVGNLRVEEDIVENLKMLN